MRRAFTLTSPEGRWVVETRFGKKRWEVVVEPDFQKKRVVVVTAYAVEH